MGFLIVTVVAIVIIDTDNNLVENLFQVIRVTTSTLMCNR